MSIGAVAAAAAAALSIVYVCWFRNSTVLDSWDVSRPIYVHFQYVRSTYLLRPNMASCFARYLRSQVNSSTPVKAGQLADFITAPADAPPDFWDLAQAVVTRVTTYSGGPFTVRTTGDADQASINISAWIHDNLTACGQVATFNRSPVNPY